MDVESWNEGVFKRRHDYLELENQNKKEEINHENDSIYIRIRDGIGKDVRMKN